MLVRLDTWANRIKRDVVVVYLAARDPRVPWYARAMAALVAAYAVSPIDLIPDFIPVLGYLDDAILLPLGIAAVVRMVPRDLRAELRQQAEHRLRQRPAGTSAAIAVVVIWLLVLVGTVWLIALY